MAFSCLFQMPETARPGSFGDFQSGPRLPGRLNFGGSSSSLHLGLWLCSDRANHGSFGTVHSMPASPRLHDMQLLGWLRPSPNHSWEGPNRRGGQVYCPASDASPSLHPRELVGKVTNAFSISHISMEIEPSGRGQRHGTWRRHA